MMGAFIYDCLISADGNSLKALFIVQAALQQYSHFFRKQEGVLDPLGRDLETDSSPLGHKHGPKVLQYRKVLGTPEYRESIFAFLRKSLRDHEKFLSHFDTLDHLIPPDKSTKTEAEEAETAFLISETARSNGAQPSSYLSDPPSGSFTTYHPLLVESHFSILLCVTLMGHFDMLLPAFSRAATLVDNLEGYPVFLPARSMAQAEFIEVLERLASGWRAGQGVGGEGEGVLGAWLKAVRTLLGPVAKRQRERAEQALNGEKKKGPINIPLHGPRVEIILGWLGATHLPDLEGSST